MNERRCEMRAECAEPVAYAVLTEHGPEEWLMCTNHCADMRANDPLDYIVRVRSLRAAVRA